MKVRTLREKRAELRWVIIESERGQKDCEKSECTGDNEESPSFGVVSLYCERGCGNENDSPRLHNQAGDSIQACPLLRDSPSGIIARDRADWLGDLHRALDGDGHAEHRPCFRFGWRIPLM